MKTDPSGTETGATCSGASAFHPGVVILAGGKSSRMGRAKLLLPWDDTTVLGHLLRQWTRLRAQQIAVVCSQTGGIMTDLDRLGVPASRRILNPAPERGMFSSVQCAASWKGWHPELTHWVITLGDQPHLREATLRALLNFAASHPDRICQPLRAGRRRHPVLLPKPAFVALQSTTLGDLRQFLESRAAELAGWESDDPGLDLDIDVPADYERAWKLAGNAGPMPPLESDGGVAGS